MFLTLNKDGIWTPTYQTPFQNSQSFSLYLQTLTLQIFQKDKDQMFLKGCILLEATICIQLVKDHFKLKDIYEVLIARYLYLLIVWLESQVLKGFWQQIKMDFQFAPKVLLVFILDILKVIRYQSDRLIQEGWKLDNYQEKEVYFCQLIYKVVCKTSLFL